MMEQTSYTSLLFVPDLVAAQNKEYLAIDLSSFLTVRGAHFEDNVVPILL